MKRYRKHKYKNAAAIWRIFSVAILLATCLTAVIPAVPVYASDDEDLYKVRTYSLYSEDIEPQKDDIFILTYNVAGSTESAEIDIDGNGTWSVHGWWKFPKGVYEITDIRYEGDNPAIADGSYATITGFETGEGPKTDTITIAIGDEQIEVLKAECGHVLVHRTVNGEGSTKEEVCVDQSQDEKTDEETKEHAPVGPWYFIICGFMGIICLFLLWLDGCFSGFRL